MNRKTGSGPIEKLLWAVDFVFLAAWRKALKERPLTVFWCGYVLYLVIVYGLLIALADKLGTWLFRVLHLPY